MISYAPRTIVNGSLLRDHLNKNVSIHVNVEPEAERHAKVMNAKTTDDLDVQIVLNEPLNTPVKGWVEIIGVPNTPTSIRNKEIILFNSDEGAEQFDKTAHNALVTFLNNCTDIFDQSQPSQF